MKDILLYGSIILLFGFCIPSKEDKKFKQVISNEELSLKEMAVDSAYTVFYCWTDWCGPCLSAMKSKLKRTKAVTDSLKIPIEYNTILYAPSINDRSKDLIQKAYENGIEVFHTSSSNALTQKLAISSDFKQFEGFEKEFMVPRIVLINKEGELITSYFPLNTNQEGFIAEMKVLFPTYVN